MNSINHCHITNQVNAHTTAWDMPEVTSDESTTEIVEELLAHGSVLLAALSTTLWIFINTLMKKPLATWCL